MNPILEEIQQLSGLPSPPKVAMQIIEVIRDPSQGASELASVLTVDPAISAKVLKVSNSPAFARSREVLTVKDAVTVLGTNTVSMISLAFSLKESIPASQCGRLDTDTLWEHSIGTAVVARLLARMLGTKDDLAFTCGLMSRVGQLILVSYQSERYSPLLSDCVGVLPDHTEEQEKIGVCHQEIGAALLNKWQIPSTILHTVESWGSPDNWSSLEEQTQALCGIIQVADAARAFLFEEDKAKYLEQLHAAADKFCSVAATEVERILVACQDELQETMSIFVEGKESQICCEAILAQAREQMMLATVEMASNLNSLTEKVETLAQSNDQLLKTSKTDALTGLANRLALNEELANLDSYCSSSKRQPYSVVMIDIDKFKVLNDTYGHDVGDRVLQVVGQALAKSARSTDFVARYGGEEFTVILHNCDETHAESVAERFRSAVGQRGIELDSDTLFVTASAGVATFNADNCSRYEEVLKRADKALYQAKNDGRNRTVAHSATQQSEMQSAT